MRDAGGRGGGWGEWPAAVLWGLALAIVTVPVFLPGTPPLMDYPNHLARMVIAFEPSAQLDAYYDFEWRNMTNLGLELVVAALAPLMPVAVATEIAVALALLVMLAGAAALHVSLYGRLGVTALLAAFFVWGGAMQFGFLAFSLGTGPAMAGLAAWVALERRGLILRLAAGTAMATALFYVHILALGIYAVMVAGVELSRLWRPDPGDPGLAGRFLRGCVTALQFLPPLALTLISRGGGLGGAVEIHYSEHWIRFKLSMLQRFFSGDALALSVVMALVVLAALALAWRRCGTPVAPRILPGLIGLGIAFIALPQGIVTGETPNWGLDWRMLTPAAMIGVAAMPDPLRTARERRAAAALILVLVAVKTAAMAAGPWRVAARDEAALAACLADMPRGGSLVAIAMPVPDERLRWLDDPASPRHLAALGVVWREAFVPSLFAFENQQPLRYRPDWQDRVEALGQIEIYRPDRVDWARYGGIDRLLVLRPGPETDPLAPLGGRLPITAERLCEGARFIVFAPR